MPVVSESPASLPAASTAYPPGWSAPAERHGPQRPGTVLAAVTVTWVSASIVLLATVSLVVFALWLGGPLLDSLEGSRRVVYLAAAGSGAWSVAAGALAWFALAGRNWARWLLVVSSAATVVVSAIGIFLLVPVVSLVSALVVPVLLFTGGANEWFRTEGGSSS